MKNPYDAELATDLILPGRKLLVVFVIAFCVFLILPVTFRLFTGEKITSNAVGSLRAQLASVERSVEKQDLFEKWRQSDQTLFPRIFGQGNRRVIVGRDGWLYYRPDLEAVFGKGPRYREPETVAREATDDSWQPPIDLIIEFANQLEQRGIELLVVPVPTKAMLAPEKLTADFDAIVRPDYEDILAELRFSRVKVFDLVPVLYGYPKFGRFLKQDTHWKPKAMSYAAKAVAKELEAQMDEIDRDLIFQEEKEKRTSRGDLVGMLDLLSDSNLFPPEVKKLQRFLDPSTGEPLASDVTSDIVLLGDSFVNIYEDPALGFGIEGEKSIGAGFASHFAAALGKRVHVIAINGGGGTAVRRAFAALPDDVVRSKKTVVWVFSARDLLLAELSARRAEIEWRSVTFNKERSPETESPDALVVTANLSERSPVGDPKQTTYESAVYSAIFTDIEGDYGKDELFAFLWAFKKRIPEPTADLKPGSRYRLQLVPFDSAVEAGRATRIDDFFRNDLDRWFVEKAELVK